MGDMTMKAKCTSVDMWALQFTTSRITTAHTEKGKTMADYIERSKLLEYISASIFDGDAPSEWRGATVDGMYLLDALVDAPTADVVEVRHGKWFLLDECANEGVYCSVCHKKVYRKEYANQKLKSPYCPNCGAKMDA